MVVSNRRWLVTLIALILTLRRSTGTVWTLQESLWLLTEDSFSFTKKKTPIQIPEVASLRKQDFGLCDYSINGYLCSRDRSWSRNAYHWECMGGSTKSQKAGRLKRLEAKIVKKPASYRDYVET